MYLQCPNSKVFFILKAKHKTPKTFQRQNVKHIKYQEYAMSKFESDFHFVSAKINCHMFFQRQIVKNIKHQEYCVLYNVQIRKCFTF